MSLLENVQSIFKDLSNFIPACRNIGLELNSEKCEITFPDHSETNVSKASQKINELLPNIKVVLLHDVTPRCGHWRKLNGGIA